MEKATIYAVIWQDMVPLSLKVDTASAAIEKAKAMNEKAKLHGLRAVRLSPDDKLETLWEPCLKDQCRSPLACSGWGYCRERNFA